MTDTPSNEPKKVSLADAIRKKLEEKKQNQNQQKNTFAGDTNTKTMKSQHNKKPNNQRRRTGGS